MDGDIKYILPHEPKALVKKLHKPASIDIKNSSKILQLIQSLTESKTIELEKKINKYLQHETSAEITFIAPIKEDYLVVKVLGQRILQKEVHLSMQNFIYREILKTKLPFVKDISHFEAELQDLIENERVKKDTSCEIIVIPYVTNVKTSKQRAVALLTFIVKSSKTPSYVTEIVNNTFKFCFPNFVKTMKLEEKTKVKRQCQSLLQVLRKMFGHVSNTMDSLQNIVKEVRTFMKAEICSLFLLEPDGKHLIDIASDGVNQNVPLKIRIAKDESVEGRVLATGKLINIQSVDQKRLLRNSVKENKDWIRNVLCFPIRDEYGIVGVLRVCNKTEGDFNHLDEEIADAFSIYGGLCIKQSLVNTKLYETQIRNKISNQLMIEHMKVHSNDVARVYFCKNRHKFIDYDTFHFPSRKIEFVETPCQLFRMFKDLNLIETFGIKENKLVKFILCVKKIYNNSLYHNWMQAFCVTHFAYVVIRKLKLIEKHYLSNLEALAYMISCMCHSIDHKGICSFMETRNVNFLENLYTINETIINHCVSQTLRILNEEEFNFLDCLKPEEYKKCLKLIKIMILASNLSNHFKIMEKQRHMIEKGYDQTNPEHKHAFICLLVTCAQFSDQIKNWDLVKIVAQNMYNELNSYNNIKYKNKPTIPTMQIQFLFGTCLPVFLTLSELFPITSDLVTKIHKHILNWESCAVLAKPEKVKNDDFKKPIKGSPRPKLNLPKEVIHDCSRKPIIKLPNLKLNTQDKEYQTDFSDKIEKYQIIAICIVYAVIFTVLVSYYIVL